MLRNFFSKLNSSLSERMVSARRRHTAPIKVWFDADVNSERSRETAMKACIWGETVDLSRTGFQFVAPSIRVNEKYLVGQERNLNIEIDLPNGSVRMRAIGRRYKKVGLHVSTERFSVGAQITGFVDGGEERYIDFLKSGRGTRKVAPALELGID